MAYAHAFIVDDPPDDARRRFLLLAYLWGEAIDYTTGEVFAPDFAWPDFVWNDEIPADAPVDYTLPPGPLGWRIKRAPLREPERAAPFVPNADDAIALRHSHWRDYFGLPHDYDGCPDCLLLLAGFSAEGPEYFGPRNEKREAPSPKGLALQAIADRSK